MNALAFDARDQDVLLAQWSETWAQQPPRLPHREVVARHGKDARGPCSLPVRQHREYTPCVAWRPAGLQPDRKSLLSIPAEAGKRATVWDLAAAKPSREFESDFTAEASFPDGRRIIGMTGSDVVVRDVTTGGSTKRWPMPDGLVSVLGECPESSRFRPHVPFHSQTRKACGSARTASGWRPSASAPAERILRHAHDDLPLRRRVRAAPRAFRFPTSPARNLRQRPGSSAGLRRQSRLLAVATTKSLSLFSVPEGQPLISEARWPSWTATPLGNLSGWEAAGLHDAHRPCCSRRGTNRLYEAVHPSDSERFLPDRQRRSAAAKLVEQVVQAWDLTLPQDRDRDPSPRRDRPGRQARSARSVVTAAGDDRMIRVWDRGGGLRWSVGDPGAGMPVRPRSLRWGTNAMPRTAGSSIRRVPCFSRGTFRSDRIDALGRDQRRSPRVSFKSILALSPDHRYLVVAGEKVRPTPRRAKSGSSTSRGTPRFCRFPWDRRLF